MAARFAWRGAGLVSPNPMVGCVLVSAGSEVIGCGHHRKFGGAHAEVEALRSCARQGHRAGGATAYVTLEPCSHFGKNPPCAVALVDAGVREVVAAAHDPGAESGGGFETLRAAGIECRLVEEPSAVRVGAPFVKGVNEGMPWVVCKWAQTVDGFTATRDGESQWISGERSRRMVHRMRGRVDAVLVGSGTARADDPMLTARGVRVRKKAVRVVIDSGLGLLAESKLVKSAGEGRVVVFCVDSAETRGRAGALIERGVVVEFVGAGSDGRVNLRAAAGRLHEGYGVQTVLCEAGAVLTGALIREGLADELVVFTAPMVFGDSGARGAVDVGGAVRLDEAKRWGLRVVRRVGDDVMGVYG